MSYIYLGFIGFLFYVISNDVSLEILFLIPLLSFVIYSPFRKQLKIKNLYKSLSHGDNYLEKQEKNALTYFMFIIPSILIISVSILYFGTFEIGDFMFRFESLINNFWPFEFLWLMVQGSLNGDVYSIAFLILMIASIIYPITRVILLITVIPTIFIGIGILVLNTGIFVINFLIMIFILIIFLGPLVMSRITFRQNDSSKFMLYLSKSYIELTYIICFLFLIIL